MKPTLPHMSLSSKSRSFFSVGLTATLLAAASLVPLTALAQGADTATTSAPVFSTTADPTALNIPVEPVAVDGSAGIQASSIRLSAIPPRVGEDRSLKGKPGETIQTVIRLKNTSDQTIPIRSFVQDFVIGEDGSTPIPVMEETSNRWSLASWVTVSPEIQTIAPNQSGNINVVINVPQDALPGGHYAMVLHEPSNGAASGEGAQARIGQRVGTLLYFFVDGPINEEAFVRNFDVQDITEYGPVPFSYVIENMSDIHITPRTSVSIHNIFGQKVDEITVEPKNVFPLMSRKFNGQWDRIWGTGLYTARLSMNYGDAGQIVLASDQFWLIPYKLVAAAGVVLLALIAMIVTIRRHILDRNRKEKETIELLEKRLEEIEGDKSDTKPEIK